MLVRIDDFPMGSPKHWYFLKMKKGNEK